MSWKVTLEIPQGKLEKVLASLPKEAKLVGYQHQQPVTNGKAAPKAAKLKRVDGWRCLTMTGKEPRPQHNSIGEKALKRFETLEAKHGIGSVTRDQFTESLGKLSICTDPGSTVSQLISNGHLAGIADD